MRLSVITVCRNAASTIGQTIRSVAAQNYPDIEYVIIDGASTDATLSVIDGYKSYVTRLISEPDKGIYNAMNKGIAAATGDALFFLNANDTFFDDRVAGRIMDSFKANPGVAIIYGNIAIDYENGKTSVKSNRGVTPHHAIYSTISHQCVFYRKNVFTVCGSYDESYPMLADTPLLLKAVRKYGMKYSYIDVVVARFSLGGVSTCANPAIKRRFYGEAWRYIREYFNPPEAIYGIARYCWSRFFYGFGAKIAGKIRELMGKQVPA